MRIIYDLRGLTKLAIVVGLVSCGAAALAQLVIFGVVASYHPNNVWNLYVPLLAAVFAIIALAGWLMSSRAIRGRLMGLCKKIAALLGVPLTALGVYALFVDSGDWILNVWPLLIGFSLLILAAEAFFPDPEVN